MVQFLASCASLFWTPAKDASVPNLVPPDKLEQANQYSLLGTFGPAPVAGLFFGLLALISRCSGPLAVPLRDQTRSTWPCTSTRPPSSSPRSPSTLLREIPKRQDSEHISVPSVAKTIWEGWQFLGQNAGGPRAGHRHGRRLRGRWGGGRPRPLLHQDHAERRQRGLGPGLRRGLRRAGRRHVPGPAHPQRVQPAAPVRPVHRRRGRPARADRADPQPGPRWSCWSSCWARSRASPT